MPRQGRPIPEGFRTITPHLVCRNASKAIAFYKKVFGACEMHRMPGPSPDSVLHAELKIGDSLLMLCDEFPEMGACSPQKFQGTSVTIHLYVENADALFQRAVQAGAQVLMPMSDMFWGDRYGKLKDPFGHEWSIATHQYDLTREEMAQAAVKASEVTSGE